jgi:hypothetical protein
MRSQIVCQQWRLMISLKLQIFITLNDLALHLLVSWRTVDLCRRLKCWPPGSEVTDQRVQKLKSICVETMHTCGKKQSWWRHLLLGEPCKQKQHWQQHIHEETAIWCSKDCSFLQITNHNIMKTTLNVPTYISTSSPSNRSLIDVSVTFSWFQISYLYLR